MNPELILGKGLNEIRALYSSENFTASDHALEDDYIDIVLSADDGAYEIFLGDSDTASMMTFKFRGHLKTHMGLTKGMKREEVIKLLGRPDKITEPKSMVVFGGERGTGGLTYNHNSFSIQVILSYPYNQVCWLNYIVER